MSPDMSDWYILDGKTPVHEPDFLKAAQWQEANQDKRRVARTTVGTMDVSTVFLGIDHRLGDGPPLLFETMIFSMPGPSITDVGNGKVEVFTGSPEYQERCSTWEEAEAMHERAIAHARSLMN
jgi:hypothetical protein